VAPWK